MSEMRSHRRHAYQSDGNAARVVSGGRDRRGDRSPPAPLEGRADGPLGTPAWSSDAQERLGRVPSFVRGMVKKIYADYARERGIVEITPAIMDTARAELGLEGM